MPPWVLYVPCVTKSAWDERSTQVKHMCGMERHNSCRWASFRLTTDDASTGPELELDVATTGRCAWALRCRQLMSMIVTQSTSAVAAAAMPVGVTTPDTPLMIAFCTIAIDSSTTSDETPAVISDSFSDSR